MAISSTDEKLAIMELDQVWEPGLMADEQTPFSDPDKQQLLWGYPGVLWDGASPEGGPRRLLMLLGVGR